MFYPFARNHNNDQAPDQEFYVLGKSVLQTAHLNLKLRYSLLKHFYTLFVLQNGRGTILKPLFFEFPDDPECFKDKVMNEQFMVGQELLVTPILEQGLDTI